MIKDHKTSKDSQLDSMAIMLICYLIAIIAMVAGIVWFIIVFWKISLFIFVACLIFYKLKTKK
jgi:hypothetical protein